MCKVAGTFCYTNIRINTGHEGQVFVITGQLNNILNVQICIALQDGGIDSFESEAIT